MMLGELGLGRKETTERRTSRMANDRPTKWSRCRPRKLNDSRKRDRFAKRKRVAWVQPANRASPQSVDDKKKEKRKKGGRAKSERRAEEEVGRRRKEKRVKKRKEKRKKGRKNCMSQGCLVRFHRGGLILDRLNTMGIQSPFFHDNYTRSH